MHRVHRRLSSSAQGLNLRAAQLLMFSSNFSSPMWMSRRFQVADTTTAKSPERKKRVASGHNRKKLAVAIPSTTAAPVDVDAVHKRAVARAMRDDFWDEDEFLPVSSSHHTPTTNAALTTTGMKAPRRKKKRSTSEDGVVAAPLATKQLHAPLIFSIHDLIEAIVASGDGTVDATSSKLLHDIASVKRVDNASMDDAVAFMGTAFQNVSDAAHMASVASIHRLCQYYAARGATLGHARMVFLLVSALTTNSKALTDVLTQVLSHDGEEEAHHYNKERNSSPILAFHSIWVDTLYEIFERPQLWAKKIGRSRHVMSVVDSIHAACALLFGDIAPIALRSASLTSHSSPQTPHAEHNHHTIDSRVRQLTIRITVVDIILKAASIQYGPPTTTTAAVDKVGDGKPSAGKKKLTETLSSSSATSSLQPLVDLRQQTFELLTSTIHSIFQTQEGTGRVSPQPPQLTKELLLVCLELASSELVTWRSADRASIRAAIADSFLRYCDDLIQTRTAAEVEEFMKAVVVQPEVMQQLRRIAVESMPCGDQIARAALSCSAAVLRAQTFASPQERLSYVQQYAQRLIDSGLPSDTLLSSQWSIGLSGQELLVVLRIKNSHDGRSQLRNPQSNTSRPLVPIPEILVRTLTSQLDSSVTAVKVMCSDFMMGALSETNSPDRTDKIAARDAGVESALRDGVQLLTEFVLRGMNQESHSVASQLIVVWQASDKLRRNAVQSFLAGCEILEEYYALIAERCAQMDLSVLYSAPHPQQQSSSSSSGAGGVAIDPMQCLRNSWTVLVSKIVEPSLGQLVSGGHIATLASEEALALEQERSGDHQTSESTRLSSVLLSFARVLSVSCAVNSHHAPQLAKQVAPLVGGIELSTHVCRHIGQLSTIFGDVCSRLIKPNRVAERQQAGRWFQIALQGILTSHPSLSDVNDAWAFEWPSVMSLLSVVEHMSSNAADTPETAELLTFRTSCLMEVVTRHLSGGQGVFAPCPQDQQSQTFHVLQTIATVMYQRRTVHLVSDVFDKNFTTCFVDAVRRNASTTRDQQQQTQMLSMQFKTLAASCVMLQKGTEATLERWSLRTSIVLDQWAGTISEGPSVAADDLVLLLRALASHMSDGVRPRVLPLVHSKFLPLVRQHESTDGVASSSLNFTVEVLRTLPTIGVDDAPLLDAMLGRILSQVDQLSLGDCGDVAGLVPVLVQTGHDSAQLLPAALADRAFEKRLLADASEVAKLVRGFSALNGTPQLQILRDKVLTGLILRCMHVVPRMKPSELLDTLEGYLSIKSSHMSLIGCIVAKIADSKDSFSLPLTIRLVTASYEAAAYDTRVSKACVTASHPVFVSLTQHFLQNDVTSLVGTSNHAELILNCLSNAFSKEPVADSVIRAVAQHCSVVPPSGILAALRLIALRGSADFNAANILFHHCLTNIIPDSSPSVLAQSTLRLAQCGIRTIALFVAVDQRLSVIGLQCSTRDLGNLCEAQLLAHRESSPVLCKIITELLKPSANTEADGGISSLGDELDQILHASIVAPSSQPTSPILRTMNLAQLRLVIMVLMAAGLVPMEEHVATLSVILNRITSERTQLTAESHESASDVLLVLQQLVRLRPFASSSTEVSSPSHQHHGCLHVSSIRDAAAAFATAAEKSIPTITGHTTQTADLAKAVDYVYCLVKLGVLQHTVLEVCLGCVSQHQQAIQQRHVLMSKLSEVIHLLPTTEMIQQYLDGPGNSDGASGQPSPLQENIAKHSSTLQEWMTRVADTCGGVTPAVGEAEAAQNHLSMDVSQ